MRGPTWSEQLIEQHKRSIREAIKAKIAEAGPAACLKMITSEIAQLEAAQDSIGDLRRFIYVVSALIYHERYGGLAKSQLDQLVDLAYALLQVNGIKPETSRLCFLYGEVQLALSQIRRRDGEAWMAAWDQLLGHRLSRRAPPGGRGFLALSFGSRALRLGDAAVAVAHFKKAEDFDLSSFSFEQARTLRVFALRISGEYDAATELAKETLAKPGLRSPTVRDLKWQLSCINVSKTGDLQALIASTRRKSEYWNGSYVLETYLWALSSRSMQWMERLPRFASLSRHKELELWGHMNRLTAKTVRTVLGCYDGVVPFTTRLKNLGGALCGLPSLLTVDKELLGWASATRWLVRNNYFEMAALTLGEYQAASNRLSGGKTSDVLGVTADLLDKAWLTQLRVSDEDEAAPSAGEGNASADADEGDAS